MVTSPCSVREGNRKGGEKLLQEEENVEEQEHITVRTVVGNLTTME